MKKKYIPSPQDKKDWDEFLEKEKNVNFQEAGELEERQKINKLKKLDLHGFSLDESSKIVKKFIIESFAEGCRKLLIVTGKGSRSKSYDNPYVSKDLSILRHSIPEYIKNDEILKLKVNNISEAEIQDGGQGAIYVFLKKNGKL